MNTHMRRYVVFALAIGGLLALAAIGLTSQAAPSAGPWYVAPGGDDGNTCTTPISPCASINGALTKPGFVAGDTILVAAGTYTGTGDEVVMVDRSVIVSGGWDLSFTSRDGTSIIDGEEARRGITVNDGVTATVEHLTLQNGFAHDGGGINNSGVLTLNNCTIRNNATTQYRYGGGIMNWGSSWGSGILTLNNSTVTHNMGKSGGGGILNWGGAVTLNSSVVSNNTTGWEGLVGNVHASGGGIWNYYGGTLVLSNTIVSGNMGGTGGGISGGDEVTITNSIVSGNLAADGGGISYVNVLVLNDSTISENTAKRSGGGIYVGDGAVDLNQSTLESNTGISDGGGIFVWGGTVTLNNATVSGNMGGLGGGIHTYSGTVNLNNSTVSGNWAGAGGGINQEGGSVILQNTILFGNTAGIAPDCRGAIGSSGYNLVGDISACGFTPTLGDLTNVDAELGQLIGSPAYHPLLLSSPAIDSGNPAGCTDHLGNPLDSDQRGVSRVGRCDIGAYEYTSPGPAASISAVSGTPQSIPPLLVFHTPLQAVVMDGIGSPVSNATVTLTAPESGASGTFADSGVFTTTSVTDESGIATAADFTANGSTGNYTVTATVSGVVTPAVFLLTNGGWYVAPSGNDGDDCQTSATPCATINAVLGKAGFIPGDTVLVATGVYTGSDDEVVLLDKDITLSGGWNGTFTTQSNTSTIDGERVRVGIVVDSEAVATIEHFTVQGGQNVTNFGAGGISNNGNLTLQSSTVRDNIGGQGGGIHNYGTLVLNDSSVISNTAGSGGGVYNDNGAVRVSSSVITGNVSDYWAGGGGGIATTGIMDITGSAVNSNVSTNSAGGILNDSTLILSSSSVDGNWAGGDAGGIRNSGMTILNGSAVGDNEAATAGGIYNDHGTVSINASTISSNTATDSGGGLTNSGTHGTLILNNSTVSGNLAVNDGGGVCNDWYTSSQMTTTLNNTVSGNTAMRGGGIYNGSGTVVLQNAILAGNADNNGDDPDCSGDIDSLGFNLIGNTSGCAFSPGMGDLVNVDAKLGPLTGSPGYHSLFSGSPAIDAGNPGGCTDHFGDPLNADQRGFARFGRCDIGAYEAQSVKTVNRPAALPGSALTYTIAFQNGGDSLTNFRITDTVPISLTYIEDSLTATGGTYGQHGGVITWTGAVNAGGAVTITFRAMVNQTANVFDSIVNSAVVSGGGEIITRTAIVIVGAQVESVVINGPATGFVQIHYSFTATVSPITATLPITYVWQATGQSAVTHTGGLSDTITFAWGMTGTQIVTITVRNAIGPPVTMTYAITIEWHKCYMPLVLQSFCLDERSKR